ncbi:hypothetical protein GCK32_004793 [Trichostrongylus colubriformis]|uniref:Uncharacterized protein n=1 Tax=Trichostrongylus colubriformis TaxID=6319 RepID=A0AAN8EPY5_TRICO
MEHMAYMQSSIRLSDANGSRFKEQKHLTQSISVVKRDPDTRQSRLHFPVGYVEQCISSDSARIDDTNASTATEKVTRKDYSIRQRHRSTRHSRHSTRPTTRSDAVFTVASVHGSYRRFATIMVDGNPIHF